LEIMTSAPTKPETFRSHLPAIVSTAAGTVLAAVIGSLMSTAGTIVGMAIGSVVSGSCSWWAERGIRRSATIAAARAAAFRARGRPLSPEEDAAVTQVVAAVHGRARPRRRWVGPAALIAAAFIACGITVTALESAVGKPLSALVQGKPGHGTTLGGGVSGPAPAGPAPTSSANTTEPAATAPASGATAGASSSPSDASPTPAATAPVTTPSTVPTAVPTAAPTLPAPGQAGRPSG
jgi:hypothetical protein